MGADVFDFPKDETVLQELIEMLTENDDLVLDFFAGSGTTAHSIFLQNQIDEGNRRFILVQLPEKLDPEKKKQKSATALCDKLSLPRNIAALAQERIRRAAAKIRADDPSFSGDTSFKLYRLASSNILNWNPDRAGLEST